MIKSTINSMIMERGKDYTVNISIRIQPVVPNNSIKQQLVSVLMLLRDFLMCGCDGAEVRAGLTDGRTQRDHGIKKKRGPAWRRVLLHDQKWDLLRCSATTSS